MSNSKKQVDVVEQSETTSFGSECYKKAYEAVCKLADDVVGEVIEKIKADATRKSESGQFGFSLVDEKYQSLYMSYGYATPPSIDLGDMIESRLRKELTGLGLYLSKIYESTFSSFEYYVSFYDNSRRDKKK